MLFIFHAYLCCAVLSVPYSLVITCWERADLLALLGVVSSCVSVIFPFGVPGQVWYLIVSIPDLCLPLYFNFENDKFKAVVMLLLIYYLHFRCNHLMNL